VIITAGGPVEQPCWSEPWTTFLTLLAQVAPWTGNDAFSLLSVLTIAAAVFVTCVRGTVDWRVTVLVAPALLLAPAQLLDVVSVISFVTGGSFFAVLAVLELGSLVLAILVWPVAIASWRGRVRRASRAAAG